MSRKIIDIHAHLGDIFSEHKNVIYKHNVVMKDVPDPFTGYEQSGFEGPLIGPDPKEFATLVNAGYERCWANTLQNLQKRMDKNGISYVCLMPIVPATVFEDYLAASLFDKRLVPFTAAQFELKDEGAICAKLMQDFKNGAKGLKIHPVLQNADLDSKAVEKVVDCWQATGQPILIHTGANNYYVDEREKLCTPEFADVKYFCNLVKKFPGVNFIAGHGGGLMGGEEDILAEETAHLNNVYLDLTFRSAAAIKKLVGLFGRNKVMFGTDNPFSSYEGAIGAVDKATAGDEELNRKILFENANSILHLE